jgi:hypothetical protein
VVPAPLQGFITLEKRSGTQPHSVSLFCGPPKIIAKMVAISLSIAARAERPRVGKLPAFYRANEFAYPLRIAVQPHSNKPERRSVGVENPAKRERPSSTKRRAAHS